MILSQVKDQSVCVSNKVHCGDHGRRADIRRGKGAGLDVSDVVTEDFDLGEGAVLLLKHGTKLCLLGGTWLARSCGGTGLLG